eukprot:14654531-Alexandrium_andersonii.AAC.1
MPGRARSTSTRPARRLRMGGLASGCCAGLAKSSTSSGLHGRWLLARRRLRSDGPSASPAGA